MALVIGTDEAGYAPNLGPLVVAATSWRLPRMDFDFYAELAEQIGAQRAETTDRLVVADSKTLYQSGGSIERLECGVLSLLGCHCPIPQRIGELVAHLAGPHRIDIPEWYHWPVDRVPLEACPNEIGRRSCDLAKLFQSKSVSLERVAVRLIFPDQFNALLSVHGNKAALLSAITLELAASLRGQTGEDCLIVCDRHGGRARYAPLVQSFLTDQWPAVVEENRNCSRYRWSERGQVTEARFVVGGESFLPTAAASMAAKYLREIMMRGWNDFWRGRDAQLKPTAGYPGDARRFLHDVRPHLQQLGIAAERIWRER
jgi:hypothetical protein